MYDPGGKWRDHSLVCAGWRGNGSRDISLRDPFDTPQDVKTNVEIGKKNQAICGKPIDKIKKIRYTDR